MVFFAVNTVHYVYRHYNARGFAQEVVSPVSVRQRASVRHRLAD
jgi:hypothetical protein